MLWVLLCLLAAFAGTLALVINKKLLDNVREMEVTSLYFVFTVLFLTPFLPFILEQQRQTIPLIVLLFITLSGVLNVVAIYLYMKALKFGNMSIVVPLRNTTPLFVVVLAAIFLSEAITPLLISSIILITVGATLVHQRKVNANAEANLRSSVYAFSVAVIAALVFIIIKYSVSSVVPALFIYLSTVVSSITVIVLLLRSDNIITKIRNFHRKAKLKYFLTVGVLTTIASLSIVYAVSLGMASVVSAFMRVELLFGVVAGSLFFKEKITKLNMMSAFLIFIGLLIIL